MQQDIDRNEAADFDAFLDQYWRDYDHGEIKPLDDYLDRFPSRMSDVTTEYRHLSRPIPSPASPRSLSHQLPVAKQRTVVRTIVDHLHRRLLERRGSHQPFKK